MDVTQQTGKVVQRRLEGRKALVTGGNSGIGRAIALRLAGEGASVVINYVAHPEAADEVVKLINDGGTKGIAIQADISNEAQVDAMFKQAAEEFGGLDILINNAGMENQHAFLEMPLEAWNKVLNVI